MTGPTYSALHAYNRTVAGLLADPEVTGDLLLIGMWLARATILRQPEPGNDGWTLDGIARDLFPLFTTARHIGMGMDTPPVTGPDHRRVRRALQADIRRYDIGADHPGRKGLWSTCLAASPRKPHCGKTAAIASVLTNPATGRRRPHAACPRHHDWYKQELAANREACAAADVPRPPANVGGRLVRHITELDWPTVWQTLDPQWTPPPEVDTWRRPTLTLTITPPQVLADHPVPAGRARPRFTVIPGFAEQTPALT